MLEKFRHCSLLFEENDENAVTVNSKGYTKIINNFVLELRKKRMPI